MKVARNLHNFKKSPSRDPTEERRGKLRGCHTFSCFCLYCRQCVLSSDLHDLEMQIYSNTVDDHKPTNKNKEASYDQSMDAVPHPAQIPALEKDKTQSSLPTKINNSPDVPFRHSPRSATDTRIREHVHHSVVPPPQRHQTFNLQTQQRDHIHDQSQSQGSLLGRGVEYITGTTSSAHRRRIPRKDDTHSLLWSKDRRIDDLEKQNRDLREQIDDMAIVQDQYESEIRNAQTRRFREMSSGRWLPQEDAKVQDNIAGLHRKIRNWSKSTAIQDMELLKRLTAEQDNALLATLSKVMKISDDVIPPEIHQIKSSRCPSLLLNALLAHEVYTAMFQHPFAFLSTTEQYPINEYFRKPYEAMKKG